MVQCSLDFSGMTHDELVEYFAGLSKDELLYLSFVLDKSMKMLLMRDYEHVWQAGFGDILETWVDRWQLELSKRALRKYEDEELPHV